MSTPSVTRGAVSCLDCISTVPVLAMLQLLTRLWKSTSQILSHQPDVRCLLMFCFFSINKSHFTGRVKSSFVRGVKSLARSGRGFMYIYSNYMEGILMVSGVYMKGVSSIVFPNPSQASQQCEHFTRRWRCPRRSRRPGS